MDVKSRLASNMRNQVLKQYKLNETKRELKKKDSKITSIIYYNNEQNVLVGYNNGKLKSAVSLSAAKAGNLTDTTIKKDGERLSPVQINDMNKTYRQIWQFEGETYGVKPGKIERLENGGGDITNIGDIKGWDLSYLASKDLMDHMGEFGSDKEFQVGNIFRDGCCQINLNPYIVDGNGEVKGNWSIGINSRNRQYKWGDYIPFDSTTQDYTTTGSVTTEYYDNLQIINKNNIDKVLTVFHNSKNRDIFRIVPYYVNEDYPSQRDKYPWRMMFGYVKMNGKLYYEKIESDKIKTIYLDKVDNNEYIYTYCKFKSSVSNTYGTNAKMNNFIKGGTISGMKQSVLRYYKKHAMQNSQYIQEFISGGGGVGTYK